MHNYVENMKNSNQPVVDDPLKKLQKYQINVMKEKRGYPLDYIISIPSDVYSKYYERTGVALATFSRIAKKKNAVMRRIVEIRQMKAKPKLSQLLNELKDPRLRDRNLSSEAKEEIRKERRKRLRKKILDLYDDSGETLTEADQMNKNIKMIIRKSEAQWEILTSIEKQINLLQSIPAKSPNPMSRPASQARG